MTSTLWLSYGWLYNWNAFLLKTCFLTLFPFMSVLCYDCCNGIYKRGFALECGFVELEDVSSRLMFTLHWGRKRSSRCLKYPTSYTNFPQAAEVLQSNTLTTMQPMWLYWPWARQLTTKHLHPFLVVDYIIRTRDGSSTGNLFQHNFKCTPGCASVQRTWPNNRVPPFAAKMR